MSASDSSDVSIEDGNGGWWYLRLYTAGQSSKSLRAFANLKKLCEEHLAGRYEIEIIDLVENPSLAGGDDIIAVPTLVRRLPPPLRKVIGDLSDPDRVLVGLSRFGGGVGHHAPGTAGGASSTSTPVWRSVSARRSRPCSAR